MLWWMEPGGIQQSSCVCVCASAESFLQLVLCVCWKLSAETCNASFTQQLLSWNKIFGFWRELVKPGTENGETGNGKRKWKMGVSASGSNKQKMKNKEMKMKNGLICIRLLLLCYSWASMEWSPYVSCSVIWSSCERNRPLSSLCSSNASQSAWKIHQ